MAIYIKNFAWDIGLQWARNRSKTLSLAQDVVFVKLDPNSITPNAVAQVGEHEREDSSTPPAPPLHSNSISWGRPKPHSDSATRRPGWRLVVQRRQSRR